MRQSTFMPPQFPFWQDNRDHPLFRVSIQGREDREPFVYDVRSFGRMVHSVRTFAECVGMPGEVTVGMANIYRHGKGTVNSFTVRVTPLP